MILIKKDRFGNNPLHTASSHGDIEIVQELLDYHARINEKNMHGMVPLHSASINNRVAIVKLLLEHGANTQ